MTEAEKWPPFRREFVSDGHPACKGLPTDLVNGRDRLIGLLVRNAFKLPVKLIRIALKP